MYRAIEGYEGLYAVDEKGNVWCHKKTIPVGKNGLVVERGGHVLRPMLNSKRTAHQRVILTKDGKRRQHQVHRLVAQAFIPNPDNLPFVNHKDCDPTNNHVSNLEWCTAKQNSIHAYQKGRWTPPNQAGSKNANSKLTEANVVQIRAMYTEVKNCSEIARRFKVNPKTINMIINGKRWNAATTLENEHGIIV